MSNKDIEALYTLSYHYSNSLKASEWTGEAWKGAEWTGEEWMRDQFRASTKKVAIKNIFLV